VGGACLAQYGELLVTEGTAIGMGDRLCYCDTHYTQTENIRHFEWRAVCECTVLMFSGWVVETRNSPRNLACVLLCVSQQRPATFLLTVQRTFHLENGGSYGELSRLEMYGIFRFYVAEDDKLQGSSGSEYRMYTSS
jgi:hypothetical protein